MEERAKQWSIAIVLYSRRQQPSWLLFRAKSQHDAISLGMCDCHAGSVRDWQPRQSGCLSLCWLSMPCCRTRFVVAVIRAHTAEGPFDSIQTDSTVTVLSWAPASKYLQWFWVASMRISPGLFSLRDGSTEYPSTVISLLSQKCAAMKYYGIWQSCWGDW